MRPLGIAAILALGACASPQWVKFEPTKYDYMHLEAIIERAIPLSARGERVIEQCRVQRIGYIICQPDCDSNGSLDSRGTYQYYAGLPEYAASLGATHVLQIDRRTTPTGAETSLTSYASPYGLSTGTGRSREIGVENEMHRLYRITNKRQYECLVAELRPSDMASP
jgi:hypothetical protein